MIDFELYRIFVAVAKVENIKKHFVKLYKNLSIKNVHRQVFLRK
ncbi:unknown [Clostridium sp. CAG:575]|nr:unknown [Clostridium sp. CAG:575]